MTITQYLQLGGDIIAALGTLATVLSHCPFIPARLQSTLARFGLTSTKFRIYVKPPAEKPL